MTIDINLNNLITKNFIEVFDDIVNCKVNQVVLKGGRSSTKSQMSTEAIIVGCMVYKASAAGILRYGNKIESRLVSTFSKSIQYLGVEKYWKLRKSPFEYVLLDENGKETNVSIKFTGADKPEDLKGFTARRGGFRYIFIDEITGYSGINKINNLLQTFLRGEGEHVVIMAYNPPMHKSNWVNKEFDRPIGKALGFDTDYIYEDFSYKVPANEETGEDEHIETRRQLIHHSTYLDVINSGHRSWLGDLVGQAAKSKEENNRYYRWAFLGEVTGTDAAVFWNVHQWDGNKEGLNIREVFRGFDWGYGGPDPCCYSEWYYDRVARKIYCLGEFYRQKMDIDDIVIDIKQYNKHNFPVFCDSAVPLLNKQLTNKGINAQGVKKGNGSIQAGVKWLQSLNGIYICPELTPNHWREFNSYEYKLDKDDNITSELPDENNHSIDATRYALSDCIRYD